MFTGIIEDTGVVIGLKHEGSNLRITVRSRISPELKIDQSLSHSGVCLTVVEVKDDTHMVTAVKETLDKTTLGELTIGSYLNLERAMLANGRFDGHIVQGHVDGVGVCTEVKEHKGSREFRFSFDSSPSLIVEKGSICVDGVSLTVARVTGKEFSVAIIPYTFNHTGFQYLKQGSKVNFEFDIIGKYIAKLVNG